MLKYIRPLPSYLIERYRDWKKSGYEEKKLWFNKIAKVGQNPTTLVISCCDSRIHVTSIFGVDNSEGLGFKINLIPFQSHGLLPSKASEE